MAFAPSPRHTFANPSQNPSPLMSPLSPSTPLASASQELLHRPGPSRRRSSNQTLHTVNNHLNGHARNKSRAFSNYAASIASDRTGRRSGVQHRSIGQIGGKDGHWASMDPDDVFRQLNVKEVKKVEDILRTSAAGKQGELRTMVSERYRDLLLSTSQISQIRDSSLKLSTTLERIEQICSDPRDKLLQDSFPQPEPLSSRRTSTQIEQKYTPDTDVSNQLPTAASVKFLLDVPEALYSYLAAGQYLEAAYLWLLARVVKEELTNSSTGSADQGSQQASRLLPLVQKQWDALAPLRSQIAERATAALRQQDTDMLSSHEDVMRSLLAILLLEPRSDPLPEVLDIFLSQRLKMLQQIHTTHLQSRNRSGMVNFNFGSSNERTGRSMAPLEDLPRHGKQSRHARKDSRLNAAEVLRGLSPVPHREAGLRNRSPSVGEDPTKTRKARLQEKRRVSEQERGFKVFHESIKVLLETVASVRGIFLADQGESLIESAIKRMQSSSSTSGQTSDAVSTVSSASLLRSMPASQILQTYLPQSIQGFSPFIGSIATEDSSLTQKLSGRLDAWIEKAFEHFRTRTSSWLQYINFITEVWTVRARTLEALEGLVTSRSAEFHQDNVQKLQVVLTDSFANKAKELWQNRLAELIQDFSDGLRSDLRSIRDGNASEQDYHLSVEFFSPVDFPSLRGGVNRVKSIRDFRSALRQRLEGRTPLLDDRLVSLEQTAKGMRNDVKCLKKTGEDVLLGQYREAAKNTTIGIADALIEATTKENQSDSSNDTNQAHACLFLARLAIALLATSKALPTLLLSKQSIDAVGSKLDTAYASALPAWRESIVARAVNTMNDAIAKRIVETATTDLENGLFFALRSIAASMLDSGIPGSYRAAVEQDVVQTFSKRALLLFTEVPADEQTVVRSVLEALAKNDPQQLTDLANTFLQRNQLHLFPVLSAFAQDFNRKPSDARFASLLPLGVAVSGNEYISPVPIVKPSARFSMLSIV